MPQKSPYQIRYFDSMVHSEAEIARIHLDVRAWEVQHLGIVFDDTRLAQTELHAIEEYYIRPGGNFLVASDLATGKIVGFVGIKLAATAAVKTGIIKRMAVVPAYHRRGIGTSLVELALKWARENSFAKITLTTGMREHAKPLYEKFGFREIGRVGEKRDYRMELVFDHDAR